MPELRRWMLATLLAGCSYDLDRIYEHAAGDAGGLPQDAGLQSTQLIAAWFGNRPGIDQECVSCAEQNCLDANTACNGDATCVAYTQCVGKTPTPAGQAACREQFADWVNQEPVRERDLNGPYGQCVFRTRCVVECEGDTDLWCTGEYSSQLTNAPTVPLHLYLIDAFDQKPLSGVMVRACGAPDLRCEHPEAMGTTDARGRVDLALPASFSRTFTGYFDISGSGRYPTLLKFSANIAQETTQVVSVVSEGAVGLQTQLLDVEPDDKRGMLQLRMLGCEGAGVKGVRFSAASADAKSKTWYIVNGVPKLDATETSPVGSGGIIDVPEGATTVTATRVVDQKLVGTADVPVRADSMSVVIYAPLGR